jgi:hypothetical protein
MVAILALKKSVLQNLQSNLNIVQCNSWTDAIGEQLPKGKRMEKGGTYFCAKSKNVFVYKETVAGRRQGEVRFDLDLDEDIVSNANKMGIEEVSLSSHLVCKCKI